MSGIIYNVTIKVEKSITNEWLHWLLKEQAPQIIATNCFTKFTTLKLLEHDDEEGSTYAIQYFAESMQHYERYIMNYATGFRKQASDKWQEKIFEFPTVMQVVS